MAAVAFAGGHQLARLGAQPPAAEAEHHQPADQAEDGRGKGVGAEEGAGDGVLDGGGAGQRGHGEREGAQGDGARQKTLGNARLAEQRGADGVDREGHHEQRDAAVGEQAAGQHDGEDGALAAELGDYAVGDGAGRAGVVHQLAEDGAEHEQREELDQVAAQGLHEDLGVGRQHQRRVTGEEHRQERHQGSEDQHVDAAVGEIHQQREGYQDA
ncbi:hypothetical protein D9M68_670960 [compost metagenome]